MDKKGIRNYTFDVTRYRTNKRGVPEFKDIKEVVIDGDNYLAVVAKLDKLYPPEKFVKQLSCTSDGYWPPSCTLWPRAGYLWRNYRRKDYENQCVQREVAGNV